MLSSIRLQAHNGVSFSLCIACYCVYLNNFLMAKYWEEGAWKTEEQVIIPLFEGIIIIKKGEMDEEPSLGPSKLEALSCES